METALLPLDLGQEMGNSLPVVTVAEAFRLAFDTSLRASGRTATDIAEEIGVSQATLTKLRKGQRGASFGMLERLRRAFGVTPSGLFDPDAALAQIGLVRRDGDTNSGRTRTPIASGPADPLGSGASTPTPGGHPEMHQDPELLTALLAYWDAITPEGRLELVGHGRRLRSPGQAQSPKARA